MVGVGVGGSQLVECAFIDCSKKSNVLRKVIPLSDYTEKQSEPKQSASMQKSYLD